MMTLEEAEALYKGNYGFSNSELYHEFLSDRLGPSAPILEVGSNIGNQLLSLQKVGFERLYGIELQSYVVEIAKQRTRHINIIQGSAFDIPYKDHYFELVFTSGVLIHINPSDITEVMKEIHRCTRKYILGFEYCCEEYVEVEYRKHANLLWKGDFAQMYLDLFDDLELVQQKRLPYLANENVDMMFLLRKKS